MTELSPFLVGFHHQQAVLRQEIAVVADAADALRACGRPRHGHLPTGHGSGLRPCGKPLS
jgi:hypothetical protein